MTQRTYTHPDVLTAGVAQGWAEPETDPARIDWPARRYLLMVERDDGYGWAVPGGHAEPGETGIQAAVRELAEETGLAVPPQECRAAAPLYVPDPRASDEAWAVTIPVHIGLGQRAGLPAVAAGDDARRAAWVPAGSYSDLVTSLDRDYAGGLVFAAHTRMLSQFLCQEALPARCASPVTGAARLCPCAVCWAGAGVPCQRHPEGDHLARYLGAHADGRITRAALAAVISGLDVITRYRIVLAEVARPNRGASRLVRVCVEALVPDDEVTS